MKTKPSSADKTAASLVEKSGLFSVQSAPQETAAPHTLRLRFGDGV